ncbi:hypothetical protein GZH47_32825 (plasmid) [Paenibacillus rhizovicinus]|uniref:Uncharacterized protein n=1 Tax=Paenibacillus rhizovicinus TaxID=2704463 RepID=A0A6C0PAS9_9BACL|nr:hypothetical protein [Paenibacillus rhizovicinus]QHW35684.1 hypothetical protein GZH47_32825 [Paenibacillus rhizovicinus]
MAVRFRGDWINKTGRRGLDNLYSGYELGKTGKLAGWGVLGAMTAYHTVSSANEYHHDLATIYANDNRGIQSLQSTQADGKGYTARNGGDPALGATGDLVFALHNLRNGGA